MYDISKLKVGDIMVCVDAPPSEEHIFFDMIEKYKLKFDLNKGIVRC